MFASVGEPNTCLIVNSDGMSVLVSLLDGASQLIRIRHVVCLFFTSLRIFLMVRQLCERQMYDFMRKGLYWPHMGSNVYAMARDFRLCAQIHVHNRKQSKLKLYFLDRPLECVFMDIFGLIPKMKQGINLSSS